jgi:hypothetical protein
MGTTDSFSDVRTFASYNIYKGKGAVCVKPILPTFSAVVTNTNTNPPSKFRTVTREGTILFEFAPPGSQMREYDWTKKSTFALDATECGGILVMDNTVGKDFFHDPNLGSNDKGNVVKTLRWSPTQDGNGMFLSLQVKDKMLGQSTISIPVSWAELEVIKSICSASIPKLLGIDQLLSGGGAMPSTAPSYAGSSSTSSSTYSGGSKFPSPPPAPNWRSDLGSDSSTGPEWG